MISFNLKSSLAIAIICFVLGCCTTFLLTGSCNNGAKRENIVMPQILKRQADSIETLYQAKITKLETANRQLQQELTTIKVQLNDVKAKAKQKEAVIKKITEPKGYPAKELLEKATPSSAAIVSPLITCDSLVQEVNEYIELNEKKEVYYETYIAIQDSIIEGKDSIIAFKITEYNALSRLFDQSLHEQQKLLAENNQLYKRFKREKRKGKLLAVGTALLSGLITHYITQ